MTNEQEIIDIGPQPGFQTNFLSTPADIAWGGGSAGCGKTDSLLTIPLYLRNIPNVPSLIFKWQYGQIFDPGGIWDKATEKYMQLPPDSRPQQKLGKFTFPSNATVNFDHLNGPNAHLNYKGSEIGFIGWDELTDFTEEQFFFLLGRNRSKWLRRPFMRSTLNPEGFGWRKDFISWYLYPPDYKDQSLADFPRPDRAGVIRFFTRYQNQIYWGNSPQEVIKSLPAEVRHHYRPEFIKSFTFIPGKLHENKILEAANPGYRGSLMALSENLQQQLIGGRWRTIDTDANRLFARAVIKDMFTNSFLPRTGRHYITADIAFSGKDYFVIGVWDGWVLIDVKIYPKADGKSVLEAIQAAALEYNVPGRRIAFDADGAGGYLRGFMETAIPIIGNAKPVGEDEVDERQKKVFTKPFYFNLRSQLYFLLAEQMKNNGVYFAVNSVNLRDRVERELFATKRMETPLGAPMRIISKDEIKASLGGESPDLADITAMRKIFDLLPEPDYGGTYDAARA
jgi:hypothetical protein